MKYEYCDIKARMHELVTEGYEPELSLEINNKEYMIIGYDDHYSFQRCGISNGSGEIDYKTIDELYDTETIDGILLSRDWKNISDFYCMEFED